MVYDLAVVQTVFVFYIFADMWFTIWLSTQLDRHCSPVQWMVSIDSIDNFKYQNILVIEDQIKAHLPVIIKIKIFCHKTKGSQYLVHLELVLRAGITFIDDFTLWALQMYVD